MQVLTVAGVLSWWLLRASLLLSALSLDAAQRPAMRWLNQLLAVDRTAAKHQVLRYLKALGATCGIFAVIASAVAAVIILTEPAKPYPRTTLFERNGGPGPILIEFGPQPD
ncbi:hypothetical protein ACSHT2_02805 [Bradyrhizobium sp. PUT101]|uniref:hypothetical protein n=1 Tax=Bradyrhizobium sp. PUT101 TaxID=3447427 RepID=UPI003F852A57